MRRVPCDVVDVVYMSSREGSRRPELHLYLINFTLRNHGPKRSTHTLFSGCHTRPILSMPTAPSFFPSQLHAMWFMACWDEKRMSRGRKAENVGAYDRETRPSPSPSTSMER